MIKSIFSLVIVLLSLNVAAEQKYKAEIPAALLTPDEVETDLLGTLEFADGFPTNATTEKVYDFLDVSRAAELFLNAMPATSMYAMLQGHVDIGVRPNYDVALTENLMDARSLWLTAQTTTPYVHGEIDVKDGPVVVELGSPVLGIIDDAFFRYVTDVGLTGPDAGQGGKYLIVGRDYEGEISDEYFEVRTSTYRHWLLLRLAVEDGDTKAAIDTFKAGFRMYPLAAANGQENTRFVNVSGVKYNTIHANDATYFDELNAVIQYEPAGSFDAETLGIAAALGIQKGQPFEPDDRMRRTLEQGAAIGNAAARAILFRPRNKSVYFYPDRQWYSPLAGGSHEFLADGARVLDDRVSFHYYATGVTPAMVQPVVGKGSVYEIGATDSNGEPLDGGRSYSVTLPGPVPAASFWSFMVYSNQTRSILETDQKSGGIDSNAKGLIVEPDGSATVYFGPESPEGLETNWVQTMPGKSYNVLLRLYGPLEPWFDRSWKPGDFELIE